MQPESSLRIHKCPPSVSILSQIDPIQNPASCFLKTHLNIILPSTPGSPKWSVLSDFPAITLYTPLLFPIRATCPAHIIPLDLITRTILGDEYRSLSSSLCYNSFVYCCRRPSFPSTQFYNPLTPQCPRSAESAKNCGYVVTLSPLPPLVDVHWGSSVFFVV